MSQPNLNRLEKRGQSSAKTISLADELKVSARWLALGTGNPTDQDEVPQEIRDLVSALMALPEHQQKFVVTMFAKSIPDATVREQMPITNELPEKTALDLSTPKRIRGSKRIVSPDTAKPNKKAKS